MLIFGEIVGFPRNDVELVTLQLDAKMRGEAMQDMMHAEGVIVEDPQVITTTDRHGNTYVAWRSRIVETEQPEDD